MFGWHASFAQFQSAFAEKVKQKVYLNAKLKFNCEDFHHDLTLVPVHCILHICVEFDKLEVHEGLDACQRALDVVVGQARE